MSLPRPATPPPAPQSRASQQTRAVGPQHAQTYSSPLLPDAATLLSDIGLELQSVLRDTSAYFKSSAHLDAEALAHLEKQEELLHVFEPDAFSILLGMTHDLFLRSLQRDPIFLSQILFYQFEYTKGVRYFNRPSPETIDDILATDPTGSTASFAQQIEAVYASEEPSISDRLSILFKNLKALHDKAGIDPYEIRPLISSTGEKVNRSIFEQCLDYGYWYVVDDFLYTLPPEEPLDPRRCIPLALNRAASLESSIRIPLPLMVQNAYHRSAHMDAILSQASNAQSESYRADLRNCHRFLEEPSLLSKANEVITTPSFIFTAPVSDSRLNRLKQKLSLGWAALKEPGPPLKSSMEPKARPWQQLLIDSRQHTFSNDKPAPIASYVLSNLIRQCTFQTDSRNPASKIRLKSALNPFHGINESLRQHMENHYMAEALGNSTGSLKALTMTFSKLMSIQDKMPDARPLSEQPEILSNALKSPNSFFLDTYRPHLERILSQSILRLHPETLQHFSSAASLLFQWNTPDLHGTTEQHTGIPLPIDANSLYGQLFTVLLERLQTVSDLFLTELSCATKWRGMGLVEDLLNDKPTRTTQKSTAQKSHDTHDPSSGPLSQLFSNKSSASDGTEPPDSLTRLTHLGLFDLPLTIDINALFSRAEATCWHLLKIGYTHQDQLLKQTLDLDSEAMRLGYAHLNDFLDQMTQQVHARLHQLHQSLVALKPYHSEALSGVTPDAHFFKSYFTETYIKSHDTLTSAFKIEPAPSAPPLTPDQQVSTSASETLLANPTQEILLDFKKVSMKDVKSRIDAFRENLSVTPRDQGSAENISQSPSAHYKASSPASALRQQGSFLNASDPEGSTPSEQLMPLAAEQHRSVKRLLQDDQSLGISSLDKPLPQSSHGAMKP